MMRGARELSLILRRVAEAAARRKRPRRGGPDTAGEPTPVEPPRNPTLTGGAAATIDD